MQEFGPLPSGKAQLKELLGEDNGGSGPGRSKKRKRTKKPKTKTKRAKPAAKAKAKPAKRAREKAKQPHHPPSLGQKVQVYYVYMDGRKLVKRDWQVGTVTSVSKKAKDAPALPEIRVRHVGESLRQRVRVCLCVSMYYISVCTICMCVYDMCAGVHGRAGYDAQ